MHVRCTVSLARSRVVNACLPADQSLDRRRRVACVPVLNVLLSSLGTSNTGARCGVCPVLFAASQSAKAYVQFKDKSCPAGTGCQKPTSGVCDPNDGDCSYTGDVGLCINTNKCQINPTCDAKTGGCTVRLASGCSCMYPVQMSRARSCVIAWLLASESVGCRHVRVAYATERAVRACILCGGKEYTWCFVRLILLAAPTQSAMLRLQFGDKPCPGENAPACFEKEDGVCQPETGKCKYTPIKCEGVGCQVDGVCDTTGTSNACTYGEGTCEVDATDKCKINYKCNAADGKCSVRSAILRRFMVHNTLPRS